MDRSSHNTSGAYARTPRTPEPFAVRRSPVFSKSPPLIETRVLESKQITMDEESVLLLKQQIANVQQIKLENERKEKVIMELRQQIRDLSTWKEQAISVRADAAVLEERLKLRDEEYQRMQNDFNEQLRQRKSIEDALRVQITKLEQQALATSKANQKQVMDLEARLAAMQTDSERRDAAKQQLERELLSVSKSAKSQLQLAGERETALCDANKKLHEQVTELSRIKREIESNKNEIEGMERQLRRDVKDKNEVIETLKREVSSLEKGKMEQAATIGTLQATISQLNEKVHELTMEASLVPDLRNELASMSVLRSELHQVKVSLQIADDSLEKERINSRLAEEEKKRLEELNSQLQRHLAEITSRYAGTVSPSSELKEKRRTVEFLQEELNYYKANSSKLMDNIAALEKRMEDADQKKSYAIAELSSEMSMIQKWIETILTGGDTVSLSFIEGSPALESMESLRTVLLGMKTRTIDALTELIGIREKAKTCQAELEDSQSSNQQKDRKIDELNFDLQQCKKQIQDQQTAIRRVETEAAELTANVHELNMQVREYQLELQERDEFLNALQHRISNDADSEPMIRDILESDSFVNHSIFSSPSNNNSTTSNNSAVDSNWESLQNRATEKLTSLLLRKESLQRIIEDLKVRLTDSDELLEKTQDALQRTRERAHEEALSLKREKNVELEQQRVQLNQIKETIVNELQSRIKELEAELAEQKMQNASMSMTIRKLNVAAELHKHDFATLQEEQQKYTAALQLLARAYRPLRIQNQGLRENKKLLMKQLRSLEKKFKEACETISKSAAEVTHSDGDVSVSSHKRSPVSFRAAVIAVIAHNRFCRLNERKLSGQCTLSGQERISLLHPTEVFVDSDIPALPIQSGENSSVAEDADKLMQLSVYLDPLCRTILTDNSMLKALADGFEAAKERKRRVQGLTSPNGSTSNSQSQVCGLSTVRKATEKIGKQLRSVERERNALQRANSEVKEDLARSQKKIADLEDNVMKKQETLQYMQERVRSLEEENQSMITQEAHYAVVHEHNMLTAEYQALQQERDRMRGDLDARLKSLVECRKDLQDALDKLRSREAELEAAKLDIAASNEEMKSLQHRLHTKTEEIETLEADLTRSVLNNEQQKSALLSHSTENSTLKSRYEIIERELANSNRTNNDLERRIVTLQRRVEATEERLSAALEDLNRKEREATANSDLIKTLTSANARANREITEQSTQIASLRAQISNLQKEIEECRIREELDLRERQEWARARLELLNVRAAAEHDLRNAVETAIDPNQSKKEIRNPEFSSPSYSARYTPMSSASRYRSPLVAGNTSIATPSSLAYASTPLRQPSFSQTMSPLTKSSSPNKHE